MLLNSLGQSYNPGAGIDIHPGNEIAMSDAQLALTAGAVQETTRNAPSGFVGLDSQSLAYAAVRVLSVDHETADDLIPRDGELLVVNDTKELRFGDGLKTGGFRAGLNSKNMIYVGGDGTAAENGAALVAAYNRARTANPNDIAKSATNKMFILNGCGIYDTAGALVQDTPFIEILGVDMYGCRLRFGGANVIQETCFDFGWRNWTFYKDTTSFNWNWSISNTPINLTWENLRFEGIATDTIVSILSRVTSPSSLNGFCKNVKTACAQLMNGTSGLTLHTNNIIFDDCEAGNRYISGVSGNRPTFAGTMRNCNWTNTLVNAYDVAATARMYNTKFGRELNYCLSGSRIEYCRFVPAATFPSIKGQTGTQNVFAAHNIFSATALDSSINNTAGATPLNVHSDTL